MRVLSDTVMIWLPSTIGYCLTHAPCRPSTHTRGSFSLNCNDRLLANLELVTLADAIPYADLGACGTPVGLVAEDSNAVKAFLKVELYLFIFVILLRS